MYENLKSNSKFISASAFDCFGGWVLDTQFIVNMGASYLLAHGLGEKVADAVKKISIDKPGKYKIWAYTKDWAAQWKQDAAPGLFKLRVNDWQSEPLGGENKDWHWQDAGSCELNAGEADVSLIDMTGFEGRCAAVFLTQEPDFTPPSDKPEFEKFRSALCDDGAAPENAGHFDIVIAGGGISGMAAAVCAAKNNLKTALIQDRFVLGGNNSSEVRVWLGGETNFEPFPKIGSITRMFEPEKCAHYGHTNTAELYEDEKRLDIINKIPNLSLFLGHFVKEASVENNTIKSVVCIDVKTYAEKIFTADLFVDATGDATLGYAAGADYEVTTNGHMGMTNVWNVKNTGEAISFPRCPWAIDLTHCKFPGRYAESDEAAELLLGGWYWESGLEHDPINRAEYARDTNFRAMYGAFDALKNTDNVLKNYKLNYANYIGGKRESRRLLGDVILTKSDVFTNRQFDDGCLPSTWSIDVHYPKRECYPSFHEGDAFITTAYFEGLPVSPYFVPYRCLYSRNINNLFMAGRNVSVSHDALGTVRVMRTGGMMGEIVGYAAGLCKKHNTMPRKIYTDHLNEFIGLLKNTDKTEYL